MSTTKTLLRPPTRTHRDKPVTVKRGKPSASGEKVDTANTKVALSPEVKAEVGKRDPDPVKKAAAKIEADAKAKTAAIKNANAESLARDEQDRKEAVLEMADDAEAASEGHKYKKGTAKKARSTGNGGPAAQRTEAWLSAKGKDVSIKDHVRMADGTVITVIGRWTRKPKDALFVPCITGLTAEGVRKNSPAAELTHTK